MSDFVIFFGFVRVELWIHFSIVVLLDRVLLCLCLNSSAIVLRDYFRVITSSCF